MLESVLNKVGDLYLSWRTFVNDCIYTTWKVSKYAGISGPYFPVFGLNIDEWTKLHDILNLENIFINKEFLKKNIQKGFTANMFPDFQRNKTLTILLL